MAYYFVILSSHVWAQYPLLSNQDQLNEDFSPHIESKIDGEASIWPTKVRN